MSLDDWYRATGLVALFSLGMIVGATAILVWFGRAIRRAALRMQQEGAALPAQRPAESSEAPTVPPPSGRGW